MTLCRCGLARTCADPSGSFGDSFADRMCAACWRAHWAEFERMRAAYRELVEAGVHPKVASRRVSVRFL